jgi:hypothetical protein
LDILQGTEMITGKKIAHRGNTRGPNPDLENSPMYIMGAFNDGFDVEVDAWFRNNKWWLGHDEPRYEVTKYFMGNPGLWIHAKDAQTLAELTRVGVDWNYFYHENDNVALTAGSWIWTCNPTAKSTRAILMISGKPWYECYTEIGFDRNFTQYTWLPTNSHIISGGKATLSDNGPFKKYMHEGFGGVCNDWVGLNPDRGTSWSSGTVIMNNDNPISLMGGTNIVDAASLQGVQFSYTQ